MAHSPHPSTDPDRERALQVGRERFPKMAFENDAEKRDYMRRVRANDNNVPGLPSIALFPPDEIVIRAVDKSARLCKVDGCNGCCIHLNNFLCPRCGADNSEEA